MDTSSLIGVGLLGVAGFMVLRGVNGEGGASGGGGFSEAIEEATESTGLTVNVPDYSDLLKTFTSPMRIVTEQIPDVPTKKEMYDSSIGHTFDIGTPVSFDPKGRPLYDKAIMHPTSKEVVSSYSEYVEAGGTRAPYALKKVVEPKSGFMGGIFGGPYYFKPKEGQKGFFTSKKTIN